MWRKQCQLTYRIGRGLLTLAEYMVAQPEVTFLYKTVMQNGTIMRLRRDFALPHKATPMSLQDLDLR